MSLPSLDAVLSCPNLPTLPAVAWRVLELTRRPDVRLSEIADVVQNDPAITARILKTINSSFYGLPSPCPTIGRAIALLGLHAVKSLVLGFSLVDSVKQVGAEGSFDLRAFWRRTIHAAAAAREAASAAGSCDPEEAFTAALLADVGCIPMTLTAPKEAAEAAQRAGGVLGRRPEVERATFGFDHAMVSAAMAERWRLPAPLVDAVRRHHDQDASAPLTRLAVLAQLAAEALIGPGHAQALNDLRRLSNGWFGLTEAAIDGLLPRIAEQAGHIAGLFKVDAGDRVDLDRLLNDAADTLAAHQVAVARESQALRATNSDLQRRATTDALTGARNRRFFDEALEEAFLAASASGGRLAVIMCDGDRFKQVNDAHGHHAGDEVLAEITARLQSVVRGGDHVCRYGGEEFAVILPGAGRREAAGLAERLRQRIAASPITVHGSDGSTRPLAITASFGVAALDDDTRSLITDAGALVGAADRALYAAKGAGRNCTRVHGPAAEPARIARLDAGPERPTGRWVLVVEDDPAFARLAERALEAGSDVTVRIAASGEAALALLASGGGSSGGKGSVTGPEVVVADMQLPGLSGVELVRAMRSTDAWKGMPVIMVTGSPSDAARRECFGAGANLVVAKGSLGDNPVGRLREIIDLWRAAA